MILYVVAMSVLGMNFGLALASHNTHAVWGWGLCATLLVLCLFFEEESDHEPR